MNGQIALGYEIQPKEVNVVIDEKKWVKILKDIDTDEVIETVPLPPDYQTKVTDAIGEGDDD